MSNGGKERQDRAWLDTPAAGDSPGEDRRILVVDDQSEIGALVERALAHEDAWCGRVDYAPGGAAAYARFMQAQERGTPYRLALIDLRMPGWDGFRTANEFWAIDRHLWIILMSGGDGLTHRNFLRRAAMPGQMLSIRKPFTLEELRRAVHAADAGSRGAGGPAGTAPTALPGSTTEQSLQASALLRRLLAADDGRAHSVLSIGIERRRPRPDPAGGEVTAAHSRLVSLAIESRLAGVPHALFAVETDVLLLVLFNCDAPAAQALARQLIDTTYPAGADEPVRGAALRLCVGLATLRSGRSRADEVRNAADVARRTAAARGGDCVQVGDADDAAPALQRAADRTATDVEHALAHERFVTWAQPIVPLAESAAGARPSFELLLRMRDRAGRLRGPATFLPVAQSRGLATSIDRMMISNALAILADPALRSRVEYLSVNVTGQLLADDGGLAWLARVLSAAGSAATQLCIEITESVSLRRTGALIEFIQRMRAQGVRFALDDFGAGFSTLSGVDTLPVDILKFDGSLVRGCAIDRRKLEILCRLNDFGRLLDKATVAEQIEDEATLECLRRSGIDYGQGYAIALPTSLEEALEAAAGRVSDEPR